MVEVCIFDAKVGDAGRDVESLPLPLSPNTPAVAPAAVTEFLLHSCSRSLKCSWAVLMGPSCWAYSRSSESPTLAAVEHLDGDCDPDEGMIASSMEGRGWLWGFVRAGWMDVGDRGSDIVGGMECEAVCEACFGLFERLMQSTRKQATRIDIS